MELSPEGVDRLQAQWWALLRPTGIEAVAAYAAFDNLAARYGEPHRHYHTLEHIAEMLRVVPRLAAPGASLPAVPLAVWFHDAICDPRSDTNEAESGRYAERTLSGLGLPTSAIAEVVGLILSTDHRIVLGRDATVQHRILHDADLAILGASAERYDRYAADIRKEYAWVPEERYRAGRRGVLQRFLDATTTIFLTERMHAEGEEAARRNLAREIEGLA